MWTDGAMMAGGRRATSAEGAPRARAERCPIVAVDRSSQELLSTLAAALAGGSVRVVDLTMPLGPESPVLPLPDPWPNSPTFAMSEISRYDERGPAWYWNSFVTGEHTGTHFDAPVHWVTGKDLPDNRVDTLPPGKFVGPACVIDVVEIGRAHV